MLLTVCTLNLRYFDTARKSLIFLGLRLLLGLPWVIGGVKVHPVQIPRFNLDHMGRIAFTGDFEALSLYQYSDQTSRFSASNGSFAVFQQLPNGDFVTLGTTDGYIRQVGDFLLGDVGYEGTVLVGNFTSIGGIDAKGIAFLNSSSGEFIPLPGLSGTVNSLLMDGDSFYVGGDFIAGHSTSALLWKAMTGWTDLPFKGFNGVVNSMEKLSDGSIAFGGSFDRVANNTYTADPDEARRPKSTGLSGLFGFNPKVDDSSDRSAAISRTQLAPGATVYALVSYNDSLFVAGGFHARGISNIFMIQDDAPIALAGGGLNDAVTELHLEQHMLYAGGNFTGTARSTNTTTGNLSNLAVFSILDQHWESLGAGVNGPVSSLNPLKVNITPGSPPETVIVVNGFFDQLQAFDKNPTVYLEGGSKQLGIWVPSAKNWLQNLPIDQQAFYGFLSSCNNGLAQATDLVCAGTLSSYGLRASLACGLAFDEFNGIDLSTLNFQAKSDNGSGTATGVFHQYNRLNLTIFAGQFTAVASDGSVVRNLAFINSTDTEVVSGLKFDFGHDSIIQSLTFDKDILYAGGILRSSSKEQSVNGIFAYNLSSDDFSSRQPPPLTGKTVQVKAMEFKPERGLLYVGGNFEGAGSIECPGVCVYDDSLQRWSRPGTGLGGSVTYLIWTDQETLVAAGNIVIEGVQYSLATFYVPNARWAPFREDQSIPGEITAMSPAGRLAQASTTNDWASDSTTFWIAGIYPNSTAFLIKWDGTSWRDTGPIFGTPSRITGIQVMVAEGATDENGMVEKDLILILTGNMVMTDASNVSAVLFNGTNVWPLVSTIDADGNPGTLTQMFSNSYTYYEPIPDAKGLVIAIAVAVIAVLISIIVIGEVGEVYRTRRKTYRQLTHPSQS
ncbi:MAG: hypothetical protein L6R38_002409 [Xanthoria sp. 2 TBL-2021]|nr:MAG: hypothetical protein L6R38_002409 [Xanthoria sp. 2 TBL-2021]